MISIPERRQMRMDIVMFGTWIMASKSATDTIIAAEYRKPENRIFMVLCPIEEYPVMQLPEPARRHWMDLRQSSTAYIAAEG